MEGLVNNNDFNPTEVIFRSFLTTIIVIGFVVVLVEWLK